MLYLLLPAVLALAPAVAGATPPQADDPRAAVPETPYRAAPVYRPLEKPATTPDRHWREANRTVLGYHPMMLTMPERSAAPQAAAPAPAHDRAERAGHHKQGGH